MRILIGNMVKPVAASPTLVKLSKAGLSFDIGGTAVVILKKFIKKIEHSKLDSPLPVMVLYLNPSGFSKLQTKLEIDNCLVHTNVSRKRRIFIPILMERGQQAPMLDTNPSGIIKFLSNYIVKSKHFSRFKTEQETSSRFC